jgi:tetratricopeptide (TPR) repeat protein
MPIAIRSFEQAIALDPDYTLAYAGMTDCHSVLRAWGLVSDATSRPPAEAALTRAMALDPMLPEVQFSQGMFIFHFGRAWHLAEPYFRRALEVNSRWSLAHAYYGWFLATAYRNDEAMAQVNLALGLDPLSPLVYAVGAYALYLGCAYPEAERLTRRALELHPDNMLGLAMLPLVLTHNGRAADAIPVAERLVALSGRPAALSLLGQVYGFAGRIDDLIRLEYQVEEWRRRGEYITPLSKVRFALGRGDGGLIRRALEDCLADNTSFASLRTSVGPFLDAWRTDGAIDELLLRLGDGVRPPRPMNTGA